MPIPPPIKLSILRDIGWRYWDPIGLQSPNDGWEGNFAADEYDGYLKNVAGRLRNGEPDDAVTRYLMNIETEHMGLSPSSDTQGRAATTVKAIREYIDTLF